MPRTINLMPAALLLGFSLSASSCGGAASAVPQSRTEIRRIDPAADPPPGVPLKIDMDAIFPHGAGRDLLLDNCTNCHSFVRIVLMQRTRERWAIVKANMRPRVVGLSDQDVDTIFEYLEASFNDSRPEPKLPKWLLETETW